MRFSRRYLFGILCGKRAPHRAGEGDEPVAGPPLVSAEEVGRALRLRRKKALGRFLASRYEKGRDG